MVGNKRRFSKDVCRLIQRAVRGFRLLNIFFGYCSFLRIRILFPAAAILVYDYSGIGDVYLFCGIIKANRNAIHGGNFVIVITSKLHAKVIELFEMENYIVTGKKTVKNLVQFSYTVPSVCNIKNITPFYRFFSADISFRLCGIFFTLADIYKYQMFKLDENTDFSHPCFKPDYKSIEQLFLSKNLQEGKTAILAPYAKTCIGYSSRFWFYLVQELKKRGFRVCTNVTGDEKEIHGTIAVSFPLRDAVGVLKKAGLFIALRSGFCDIVCSTECKQIILYPDYRMFNSTIYEFCSFKKMGIGRDIVEIQGSLNDEEKLLEKILEEIDGK